MRSSDQGPTSKESVIQGGLGLFGALNASFLPFLPCPPPPPQPAWTVSNRTGLFLCLSLSLSFSFFSSGGGGVLLAAIFKVGLWRSRSCVLETVARRAPRWDLLPYEKTGRCSRGTGHIHGVRALARPKRKRRENKEPATQKKSPKKTFRMFTLSPTLQRKG